MEKIQYIILEVVNIQKSLNYKIFTKMLQQ